MSRKNSPRLFLCTAVPLFFMAAELSLAQSYTYSPPMNTGDLTQTWSSGTNWSAVPVSGSNANISITPVSYLPDTPAWYTVITSQADVSGDTPGQFTLNTLSLYGSGPSGSYVYNNPDPLKPDNGAVYQLTGNALEFVNNNGSSPYIYLRANRSATRWSVANNLILRDNLTMTTVGTDGSAGRFTFSGSFSGPGNLTINGATNTPTVALAGVNSGYAGNVTVTKGRLLFTGGSSTANTWVTSGSLTLGASGELRATGYGTGEAGNAAFSALYGTGRIYIDQTAAMNFGLNYNGSSTDVFGGIFTAANGDTTGSRIYLNKYGTGDFQLTNSFASDWILGNYWGDTTAPAQIGRGGVYVGAGTMKVTASSGAVIGVGGDGFGASILSGGTLHIGPGGSGADVVVTGSSQRIKDAGIRASGARILLDRGSNNSLTFQHGNTANDVAGGITLGAGGLIIGAASGLDSLGVAEKFVVVGASSAVTTALKGAGAVSIINSRFIGQDNDANLSGDFLSYIGTGLATDTGFVRFNYANGSTNFAGANDTKVTRVTEDQTIDSTSVYALRNDADITLRANQILTIGNAGDNGAGLYAGLILNGGTISGGTVDFVGRSAYVYTNLQGGHISSRLAIASGRTLSVNGPGILRYDGASYSGNTLINSGSTFDVANGTLGTGYLQLRGGVLQSQGSFTRALGTGNNQVSFADTDTNSAISGGGFAARGGDLTVNIGGSGSTLVWNSTANFIRDGGAFVFGSTTADHAVIFQNNIDLGGNGLNFSRIFHVIDNVNSSTDVARITGNITSTSANNGIAKDGNGTLILEGTNTYQGATYVAAGTLLVHGSLTQTSGVTVQSGATLGGNGTINSAISVEGGATFSPGASIGSIDTGTLTLASTAIFKMELNSDTLESDLVTITGDFNLASDNSVVLSLSDLGTNQPIAYGTIFTLVDYSGSWNGYTFAGLADDSLFTLGVNTFRISYNGADNLSDAVVLQAVPEPTTCLLAGMGLATLLWARRRRHA